jgi:hypothetical protein
MRSFDLRTELYRLRLPIYQVASQVRVHPSRLSLYLNGRLPMPPELRNRLEAIVAMYDIDLEQSDGNGR